MHHDRGSSSIVTLPFAPNDARTLQRGVALAVCGCFAMLALTSCAQSPRVAREVPLPSSSEDACGFATCASQPKGLPNHGQGQSLDEGGCELAARAPYYVTVFDDAGNVTVFLYCLPKETRT